MPGDYVPFDHDFPDKPEVLRLCSHIRATCAQQTRNENASLPSHEVLLGMVMMRLHKLWRMFDRQTTDGVLAGLDLAVLAGTCGGDEAFWQEVIKVGWLAVTPQGLEMPGFKGRFRTSAKERMRQYRERKGNTHVTGSQPKRNGARNAVTPPLHESCAPEPEPEPEPKTKNQEPDPGMDLQEGCASAHPCVAEATPKARKAGTPDDVRQVFAHYRTYHPKAFPNPAPKSKEWVKIAARLREGHSVADLCAAIDGCHRSPFHCGENDRGKVFQSLELIVRDGTHVNQFLEIPAKSAVVSEREMRGMRAAAQWLERRNANGQHPESAVCAVDDGPGVDVPGGD